MHFNYCELCWNNGDFSGKSDEELLKDLIPQIDVEKLKAADSNKLFKQVRGLARAGAWTSSSRCLDQLKQVRGASSSRCVD